MYLFFIGNTDVRFERAIDLVNGNMELGSYPHGLGSDVLMGLSEERRRECRAEGWVEGVGSSESQWGPGAGVCVEGWVGGEGASTDK